uniref:Ig-like domain-containing protein n=1 Tax=Zonotrichia albicollis TaxID=44394 RepID=A0A8D2M1C4_ZONAL
GEKQLTDCGLFLLSAAVTGQVALEQQPRRVTMQEGDEFTLECRMKGDRMSNCYMYWYRLGPQGSLEWIFREVGHYRDAFKNRFKARVQSYKNSFTLQILAAEQGDGATYYCGAEPPWSSSAAE